MACRTVVTRAVRLLAEVALVAGLAGCNDGSGSTEKIACSKVAGVWNVTMMPCEGFPDGLFQTWEIVRGDDPAQGQCSFTITTDEPDLSGPLIADFPVTAHGSEGDLWAQWVKDGGDCHPVSTLDAHVGGSTFSGFINNTACVRSISCQVIASRP